MRSSNGRKTDLQVVVPIALPDLVGMRAHVFQLLILRRNESYDLNCRIYLYLYYVPIFMLWSEEAEYTGMELGLWLWFAAECLDSVRMRREIVIYRLFHLNYKVCHETADISLSLSLSLSLC